jgi:selenocysteine lyase/cysteine desulfurase
MNPKDRRNFLKIMGGTAAGISISPFFNLAYASELKDEIAKINGLTAKEVAKKEDFWSYIQQSYTTSNTIINLNNGGVSPQPKVVQDAFVRFNEMSNEAPSYYMWRVLDKGREPIREKLALLADCSPEEIAINRNTTEALETIIFGLNLKKGDEVVVSNFDYPNMMNSWKQRAKRDGVILKTVQLDAPMEDDDEILKRYEQAITAKTKIVHITHMINWTGQILPAKAITQMAHDKGAEVILDGAHSFAHIDYSIRDINCDYYGTSLHKWLCAPFGTGFLFVKKEKISKLWTLFSNEDPNSNDIRKFEALGTRSFPTEQGIGNAIDFHNSIGIQRKQERLNYLKNYWIGKIKDNPNIILYTSLLPDYSCALATFGIKGKDPLDIGVELFQKYKIHTTSIDHEGVKGVRITPHVYTTLNDLDKLIMAINDLAS